MTTLTNQVTIAAPHRAVWQALTHLDLLDQYDPGGRCCVLGSRSGPVPGAVAGQIGLGKLVERSRDPLASVEASVASS